VPASVVVGELDAAEAHAAGIDDGEHVRDGMLGREVDLEGAAGTAQA
jgi:hypothetical protein